MSNPQQPEIGRSRRTPGQDPDRTAAVIEGSRPPADDGPRGPVPAENQPGHHPPEEQDRPDLDAFADRLGTSAGARPPAASGAGPEAGGDVPPRRMPGAAVGRAAAAVLAALAVLVLTRVVRRRRSSA